MIILPREEPVVVNLNSYFLKIDKLVEHYQGEVGTGCIYFKSPSSEAVIFFDEANLINSYYSDKKEQLLGKDALDKIIDISPINNFSVSVFHIVPERLYYWANQAHAEVLYSDLNSEFTDFEGLINKLEGEKHNGCIDVKLNQNAGGGILFLFNGLIIGCASEKGDGGLDRSTQYQQKLLASVKKLGGVFNVKKIQLNIKPISISVVKSELVPAHVKASHPAPERRPEPKPAAKLEKQPEIKAPAPSPAAGQKETKKVLEMLEALLSLLERVIQSNKKLKVDFETLLNKKFVEKADKYDFLDPFFDEFRYSNGRVDYAGKASADVLVSAITECVREIVLSLGIVAPFRKYLESWKKGFANEIIDFDIEI
ncbi:MAG: hypothetical protein MUE70_05930 [Desulfobacterales bacterium]|nr:hypothetical protein [Desulfobacterales bacterium]